MAFGSTIRQANERVIVMTSLRHLLTDRRGVTALEYGIIAAMLAFVLILVFERLGATLMAAGAPIFNAL